MSATPIPRTLALIIYGDLDVSVIDQLPARPAEESTPSPSAAATAQRLYAFLRQQVPEGRQVLYRLPAWRRARRPPDERKAVTEYAEPCRRQVFPDLRIALLHGQMKPKEKEAVMAAFAAGETDLLVATTVIEVGVDVPNATVMVVENADRFGLSQLHQLRGRVGRGNATSPTASWSPTPRTEETRPAAAAL